MKKRLKRELDAEKGPLAAKPLASPALTLIAQRSLGFYAAPSSVNQTTGDPVEYTYNDKSSLALGRGFSPNDVTGAPKLPVINWTSEPLNPGPPSTEFRTLYVKSYEEMSFALGLDIKVEASYLGASGTAHTGINSSFLSKRNSITVVVTATTNFGRWGLKAGAALTDEGRKMLSNPRLFEERCGSRYVSIEGRGASVSALITLTSVSTDTKLAFEAEISGGGGWGALSAKASAIFRTEAKSSSSQDRLEVQVFATGGSGLGGLASTVNGQMKSNTGIEQAMGSLGDLLKQFDKTNAATTYYRVSSMEYFGWDPSGLDPWTDLKEGRLRILAKEYRKTAFDVEVANGIIQGTHPLALVLSKTDVKWIEKELPRAEAYVNSLAKAHKACKLNRDPTGAGCDLPFNKIDIEGLLLLRYLDPPRVVVQARWLTDEQTRIVLQAPPESRTSMAGQYNPEAKQGIAALFKIDGYNSFALGVKFVDDKGVEEGIYTEGPWSDGAFLFWYSILQPGETYQPMEDWFKMWMVSRSGRHSGTVFITVKDKMHRTFRIAFMNVTWESNGHVFTKYEYELVY